MICIDFLTQVWYKLYQLSYNRVKEYFTTRETMMVGFLFLAALVILVGLRVFMFFVNSILFQEEAEIRDVDDEE